MENEDLVDFCRITRSGDQEQGVSFDQPPKFDKILRTPNKVMQLELLLTPHVLAHNQYLCISECYVVHAN